MHLCHHRISLLPYTTLFRSEGVWDLYVVQRFGADELENRLGRNRSEDVTDERRLLIDSDRRRDVGVAYFTKRSEEHTSELQSRGHLVYRLLLEKKQNNTL